MLAIGFWVKNNFDKCVMYFWEEIDTRSWANLLGFKIYTLSTMYLGASIGTSPRRKIFWKSLIDKFRNKLAK